ncbi:MAG: hypothetical protein H0W01_00355 [Pseudonocardiales bacterium]|nr:hypothetical protein [Pseudonocardiales bacterium]
MADTEPSGSGTPDDPWILSTPPGTSQYEAYRDEAADPPAVVVQVGKSQLRYHLRAIEDLHKMLAEHGGWVPLGSADEQKSAADGTVEAWGRSADNPVGGWYGIKKGMRGRFGMYVPPVLEALGLAEVEHNPRNNRMRAR